MLIKWSFVHVLILIFVSEGADQKICATYGDCGNLPCVSDTLPEALSLEGRDIIENICPHLKNNNKFCCDDNQAKKLKEKLKAADKLLKSCNTAMVNFRALICDMTCSPDQGSFVKVTDTKKYNAKTAATKLDYHLSEDYANKVWRSIYRTNHLICGNLFKKCKEDELFNYIGNNRWTSLKTNYIRSTDSDMPSPSSENVVCKGNKEDRCDC